MNCYICGAPTEPRLDFRDMKTRPCFLCEEIIAEAVSELDEEHIEGVYEDEDELSELDLGDA